MSSQATIVLTASPRGRFFEGIVSGTPKPGVCMQPTTTAAVNGRFTWQVFTWGTDGERALIVVLREDDLQGYGVDQAYVTGTICQLYAPLPGDELQMILQDIAGTGALQDLVIGNKLIVDNGTGKLLETTGSPEAEPFVIFEAITDLAADTLVHVMFTGA